MKEFNLGKHRKARVWLNELPDISHSSGAAQEVIMPTTEPSMQAKKAAVEVFVPLGPRSMYGLLGGKFEPSTVGELKVTIVSNAANGKLLPTSLAGVSDQVRIGLPKEYHEAVKEGVRLAQKEGVTISGELVIDYAANGEIGSCFAVFKHLAAVLVKLFDTQGHNPIDEEIISFFPQTFA